MGIIAPVLVCLHPFDVTVKCPLFINNWIILAMVDAPTTPVNR